MVLNNAFTVADVYISQNAPHQCALAPYIVYAKGNYRDPIL